MNIAHIEEQSFIYGPGCRFVIWTQGCSIRCPGCWNDSMWDFSPKLELSIQEVFDKISQYKDDIEGITLLGGEPLDQYEETLLLLRLCKAANLSTVVFTGYEPAEITGKKMTALFDLADILITGRYKEELRTLNHQWIGSTNQEIHFLSGRYKSLEIKNANYTEFSLDEDGSMTILGFPEKNIVELLDGVMPERKKK